MRNAYCHKNKLLQKTNCFTYCHHRKQIVIENCPKYCHRKQIVIENVKQFRWNEIQWKLWKKLSDESLQSELLSDNLLVKINVNKFRCSLWVFFCEYVIIRRPIFFVVSCVLFHVYCTVNNCWVLTQTAVGYVMINVVEYWAAISIL